MENAALLSIVEPERWERKPLSRQSVSTIQGVNPSIQLMFSNLAKMIRSIYNFQAICVIS